MTMRSEVAGTAGEPRGAALRAQLFGPAARQKLLVKEKKLAIRLDKREPLAARKSALLHRLRFLEIPFAALSSTGGDFSGTIFREDWQLKWDPKTEPSLIEQNLYGDTIESAAVNRLQYFQPR